MSDQLANARVRSLVVYRNDTLSWLNVPSADLLALNIAHKISSTSYLAASTAFLTEATYDAVLYVNACVEAGWLVRIDDQRMDAEFVMMIKSTGIYHPHWVKHPIGMDSVLCIQGEPMRVVNEDTFFWYVAVYGYTQITHRIDKLNPYQYITPPEF